MGCSCIANVDEMQLLFDIIMSTIFEVVYTLIG